MNQSLKQIITDGNTILFSLDDLENIIGTKFGLDDLSQLKTKKS